MHTTRLPKMLTQSKGVKKQAATSSTSAHLAAHVPKGHLAVYVRRAHDMSRFVIPVAYLNHPWFQGLLREVEEEFGFEHPMGGLTLPCSEQHFLSLISQLSGY